MKPSALIPAPAIVVVLLALDLALALAYVCDYMVGTPFRSVTRQLDLDGEGNLTAWYSSMKLFSVFLVLAQFARRRFRPSSGRSWVVALLALSFLALSADETAQLHEWLGRRTDALLPDGTRKGTFFRVTGIWMFVIGIPFVAVLLGMVYAIREEFRAVPRVLGLFLTGVLVWLTGALGIEILSNLQDQRPFAHVLQIASEEAFEMVGATLILWAAYDLDRLTRPGAVASRVLATREPVS